jgi:BirA family transcriptional regulator, biotin operon repressor / biotin---[acetyl-CoA-carboxylase] ligase
MERGRAILEAFYQAAEHFVSASELQRLLGRTGRRIGSEIADLEKLGYVIESHPHFGYRLLASPDRLTADDIKARLKSNVIGSEILVFEETASTNDVIEQLAKSGAREGVVVFAESQRKGRGRHGRTWVSPRGKGLWFSVLLRPQLPPAATSRVTVAASVAVTRALRQCSGVDARIKWPNDVIANGRKLAGILVEAGTRIPSGSQASSPREQCIILGIGINVNCKREDFSKELVGIATSLELESGRLQDRTALAAQVLATLDEYYRRTVSDFEMIADEWAQLCTTLGKQIIVTVGRRRIEGFAQALDGDGALLLRRDSGQIERIVSGDLALERT